MCCAERYGKLSSAGVQTTSRVPHSPTLHAPSLLQGKAYHGVSVPGFCLAEAGNHWHALHTAAPGVAAWLADWCELQERSPEAWGVRMDPMWFYFQQLQRILASGTKRAGPAGLDLAAAINQLLKLQRNNH